VEQKPDQLYSLLCLINVAEWRRTVS